MWIAFFSAAWVAACGAFDWRSRLVPNWLMGIGWLGAAGLRLRWILTGEGDHDLQATVTVVLWLLVFYYWLAGWWGAADTKFVMALALAFPDPVMLLAMFLLNLIVALLTGRAASSSDEPLIPGSSPLPAVTILSAGWLAWAALTLLRS
jgi:Flp pilus assembly protein protease CpaA